MTGAGFGSDWMGQIGVTGTSILMAAAIKGLVVFLLAAGVVWTLRRASAAARHLVWLTAMVSLFFLPMVSAALPAWRLLPQWMTLSDEQAPVFVEKRGSVPVASKDAGSMHRAGRHDRAIEAFHVPYGSAEQNQGDWPTNPSDAISRAHPADTLNSAEDLHLPAASPTGPVVCRWLAWITLVWAGGTLIAFAPLIAGMLSLRRLHRSARQVVDGPLADSLGQMAADLGVRRRVELLTSDERWTPMQWGFVRPKLLLPAAAQDWPEERLRSVLLHELAHLRRWDYLTQFVVRLVCAVYWFHPLVWFARHRMYQESEAACDDVALGLCRPANYARHLLEIASEFTSRGMVGHVAIAMARRSMLEKRLHAILDRGRNRQPLPRWAIASALVSLLGVVVPLAMLRAAGEAPKGQAPTVTQTGSPARSAENVPATPPNHPQREPLDPRGIRYAEAVVEVTQSELNHAEQANQRMPGSVRPCELRRLELEFELARLQLDRAWAITRGEQKTLLELDVRLAKIRARVAEVELDGVREILRKQPRAVVGLSSELKEILREREANHQLATLDTERAEAALRGDAKILGQLDLRRAELVQKRTAVTSERIGEIAARNGGSHGVGGMRVVAGKVTDEQGKPVPGAQVWLRRVDGRGSLVTLRAQTDDQGRYVLQCPGSWNVTKDDRRVPWTVWAYAPGRSLATARAYEALAADKDVPDVDIVFGSKIDSAFVVLGPDGHPLADAVVEPDLFHVAAAFESIPEDLQQLVRATTGPDGRATLRGVPWKGLRSIRISTRAFGVQCQKLNTDASSDAETTIRLRPAGRVEGRVIADYPGLVRGVRVYLTTRSTADGSSASNPSSPMIEGHAQAISDDQGRFVVPALATGVLGISASVEQGRPLRPRLPEGLQVEGDRTTNVEIRLVPAVRLEGQVQVKGTGEPVAGAEVVVAYGKSQPGGPPESNRVVSDKEGKFSTYVLPGSVACNIEFPSGQLTRAPDDGPYAYFIPEGVDYRRLPPFKAVRTQPIEGRLVDDRNQPLANTLLIVTQDRSWLLGGAQTKADGSFCLSGIPIDTELNELSFAIRSEDLRSYRLTLVREKPLLLRAVPQ